MKRYLSFFCALVLLLLSACAPVGGDDPESLCRFYYPAADGSTQTLVSVSSGTEPSGLSAEEFLHSYLGTLPPQSAQAVVPQTWTLASAELEGSVLYLTFTGEQTDALRRSLALACLTKTLVQHPQVEALHIITPESEVPAVLTEADILLTDNGMEPQQEQVVLYAPDEENRYLVSETRQAGDTYAADKPAYLLRTLLAQDDGSGIPQGTELLSVSVENGVCTVNFSAEFEQNMAQQFSAARMAVYSVVNTLTELPEVSTVDFWVAGAPLKTLCGMDLSQGVSRDESLIWNPDSRDLLDISLYPACGNEGLLAEVPTLLELPQDGDLIAAVIQALLSFEGKNGLYGCIPQGTKLLSVRMEGTSCILDFTGEFLAGCHNSMEESLAVHSVIATLCALESIQSVEILVEGIEPEFRDSQLARLRWPQDSWVMP